MVFVDSWAWLEVTLPGERVSQARAILERGEHEGIVVSTTVLTEVYYVLSREKGERSAERAMEMIRRFESLTVLPVTEEIAIHAARLRRTYYSQSNDRTPSYADAINLATAIAVAECDRLCTGDSDLEDVSEITSEVF